MITILLLGMIFRFIHSNSLQMLPGPLQQSWWYTIECLRVALALKTESSLMPALPFTTCVTLGNVLNFSEPKFTHM